MSTNQTEHITRVFPLRPLHSNNHPGDYFELLTTAPPKERELRAADLSMEDPLSEADYELLKKKGLMKPRALRTYLAAAEGWTIERANGIDWFEIMAEMRKREGLAQEVSVGGLDSEDLDILRFLAENPGIYHDQVEIEIGSGVSRRSLTGDKGRLAGLRKQELVERKGQRGGDRITQKGLARIP